MPEDNLDAIITADQQIEKVAETLFRECPTCEGIISYLTPRDTEETRSKTEEDLQITIGAGYKHPFTFLLVREFLGNEGNRYMLSKKGLVLAEYAKPVDERLRV